MRISYISASFKVSKILSAEQNQQSAPYPCCLLLCAKMGTNYTTLPFRMSLMLSNGIQDYKWLPQPYHLSSQFLGPKTFIICSLPCFLCSVLL